MTIDESLIVLSQESQLERFKDDEKFEMLRELVILELNKCKEHYGVGCKLPHYLSRAIEKYSESHTFDALDNVHYQIGQWKKFGQTKKVDEVGEKNLQPKEKLNTFLSGLIPTVVLLIVGLILGFVVFKGEGEKIDIAYFVIESVKDILAGLGSGSVYKAIKNEPTKSSMVIGVLCIWFSVAAMIIMLFLMGFTTLFSTGRNVFWWVGATILVVAALGLTLVVKSYDKNKYLKN